MCIRMKNLMLMPFQILIANRKCHLFLLSVGHLIQHYLLKYLWLLLNRCCLYLEYSLKTQLPFLLSPCAIIFSYMFLNLLMFLISYFLFFFIFIVYSVFYLAFLFFIRQIFVFLQFGNFFIIDFYALKV